MALGEGQGGQISSMSAAMLLFMLPSNSFLAGLSFSLDAASFSETKPMSDVTTRVCASIGSGSRPNGFWAASLALLRREESGYLKARSVIYRNRSKNLVATS